MCESHSHRSRKNRMFFPIPFFPIPFFPIPLQLSSFQVQPIWLLLHIFHCNNYLNH